MGDIIKKTTLIAVKEESTQGTYAPPTLATDYIQPLEDGFEQAPTKELVERNILLTGIGQVEPRAGLESVTASLPVEFRASGTEGAETDYDLLLKGALGNQRQQTARTTTGTGHTTTQLNLSGATIGNFAVGDGIVILETGAHHIAVVTAVDTTGGSENITYAPAASGAPSDNVETSKFTTYHPASTGHPPLSVSFYEGDDSNAISRRAIGCLVTGLSLDNFTVGQIASWNFSLEGLTFDEVLATSPIASTAVTFDSGVPPLILNACVYQSGTQLNVNNFSLSLTNTVGTKTDTCLASGKSSSRVTDREITGTMDPFADDTDITQFTNFDTNTSYSLIVTAHTPSTTTGEVELGTVVTIYLPNCLTTEKGRGDLEDILQESITFSANRGANGDTDEIFVSVI